MAFNDLCAHRSLSGLRLWLEFGQRPAQSNRFAGWLGPRSLRSRRSRVTLVKDEMDDLNHRVERFRTRLCLGAASPRTLFFVKSVRFPGFHPGLFSALSTGGAPGSIAAAPRTLFLEKCAGGFGTSELMPCYKTRGNNSFAFASD